MHKSQKIPIKNQNPILYQSQVGFSTWLIKSIHIIHSVKRYKYPSAPPKNIPPNRVVYFFVRSRGIDPDRARRRDFDSLRSKLWTVQRKLRKNIARKSNTKRILPKKQLCYISKVQNMKPKLLNTCSINVSYHSNDMQL